jgi:VanZ family protein
MAIYLLRLIVKTFNPNAGIVAISPGGSAAEPDLKTRKILTWIAFGSTYFVLGIGAAVLSGHNNLTIWIVVGFFAIMILFRWFAIIIDTYARKVKNKRPTV